MKTYNLERFIEAQEQDYSVALSEIKAGHKYSHWIWYIFPQLEELGRSRMAKFYGIGDIDEARAYLNHPVLGARLKEICEALMQLKSSDPSEVMGGYPDDLKLQSCMTLFAEVSEADSVFHRVLDKFFAGQTDAHTLSLLRQQNTHGGYVLTVLILCAGMLLSSVCSTSYAEEWKTGEIRTLSTDYIVDGHSYELIKGTFRFPYDDPPDGTGIFFFTKGFFAEDPYTYNPHLAAASMCMAMAGCYSHDGGKGRNTDYSNKNKNAIQYLKDIGCQNIRTNIYNTIRPQTDSIGVTLGSQYVDMPDGTRKALVAVAIRGANYEREWASNVTIGSSADHNGEAQGFAEAADMVVQEIQSYVSSQLPDYEDYNGLIFWVAGYSRGGAAANLAAKRLVDICSQKGAANAKIFAYCFEAPMGGFASAEIPGNNYSCIHNVVNPDDVAPKLAPSLMGFKRYGVDHHILGTADKNVMIKHLHALNQSIDVSLLKEEIPAYGLNISLINKEMGAFAENAESNNALGLFFQGYILYEKYKDNLGSLIPTKQNVLMHEFLDDFMSNIQSWTSLTRNVYIGMRENGVSYGSIQQAARDFMSLFDDLPDSERNEFKNRITSWVIGDMLGALDLVANFCKAFGDYHTYDSDKKNMIKTKLVEWIKGSQCFDALSLTAAEKERVIDYDLRTLIDFLMTYLSQDFRHPMYGVEGLTQFLTMLSAANTLKLNHYAEVNMAWLRAMDSFYAEETEIVTRASGAVSSEVSAAASGATEGRVFAGYVPVDGVTADYGADYIALLPAKTYIECTNGDIDEAAIIWDTVNYERYYYNETDINEYGDFAGWTQVSEAEDSHPEAAHIYVFSGRVNVPDGVRVVDQMDTELRVSVFAAGLPKMEAPKCWLPDGDYVGAVSVDLYCEEDAEIYYSVNGAGIVNEKYTGPFTLEVGGGVSEDYDVIAYTKSSGEDRADSRPVVWSYTLWKSEAAMYGGDSGSTGSGGSSGGGCEVSCSVLVMGLALMGVMVHKVRG